MDHQNCPKQVWSRICRFNSCNRWTFKYYKENINKNKYFICQPDICKIPNDQTVYLGNTWNFMRKESYVGRFYCKYIDFWVPGPLDQYVPCRQRYPISFNGSLVWWTTKTAQNKYDQEFVDSIVVTDSQNQQSNVQPNVRFVKDTSDKVHLVVHFIGRSDCFDC